MLPGVAVWFLIQRKPRIGLRTRWPYLAAVAFLVAYAPVILYNVQTGLAGVNAAESGRSYLWQPNPSPAAFAQNLWRLTLQLCRQVSGVLEGDETLQSLLGMPLLFCAWAIAGLIYAARRRLTLPALAVGSQLLIMPWLSNHYGLTGTTRFTNQLTPLIFVAMAALAAGVWRQVPIQPQPSAVVLRPPTQLATPIVAAGRATCILLVALSLWPLTSLFRYYEHRVAAGETNAHYFAFADEFMRQWRGEKIFLSSSGVPQATEYFLAIKAVPYTRLPVGRIMEQLATGQETGRVTLILTNDDRSRAQAQADMTVWDSPAMQDADKQGYGAITIADARQVRKPSFVLTQHQRPCADCSRSASQFRRRAEHDRLRGQAEPRQRRSRIRRQHLLASQPCHARGLHWLCAPGRAGWAAGDARRSRTGPGLLSHHLLAAGRSDSRKVRVDRAEIARRQLYTLGRGIRLPVAPTAGRALSRQAYPRQSGHARHYPRGAVKGANGRMQDAGCKT